MINEIGSKIEQLIESAAEVLRTSKQSIEEATPEMGHGNPDEDGMQPAPTVPENDGLTTPEVNATGVDSNPDPLEAIKQKLFMQAQQMQTPTLNNVGDLPANYQQGVIADIVNNDLA